MAVDVNRHLRSTEAAMPLVSRGDISEVQDELHRYHPCCHATTSSSHCVTSKLSPPLTSKRHAFWCSPAAGIAPRSIDCRATTTHGLKSLRQAHANRCPKSPAQLHCTDDRQLAWDHPKETEAMAALASIPSRSSKTYQAFGS